MSKEKPELVRELGTLLAFLKKEFGAPPVIPPEQVRRELFEMGIDTGPAQQRLKQMIRPAKQQQFALGVDDEFAMAADDGGGARTTSAKTEFLPLGTVSIDGVPRQLLTDGERVFVRLNPTERYPSLVVDGETIKVETTGAGSMAMLLDFGRTDALLLVQQMEAEPRKHVISWGTTGQEQDQ